MWLHPPENVLKYTCTLILGIDRTTNMHKLKHILCAVRFIYGWYDKTMMEIIVCGLFFHSIILYSLT